MNRVEFSYLRFVKFKNIDRWDIKSLSGNVVSFRFPAQKLKTFLSKADIEWIDIEDDKEYPILGVHAQGEGVYINKIASGKELTMKRYQKSKPNTLFYCKVRTVKGQWGIVFPEFANSYGSSNMQYLDVDYEKINPEYFINLLKLKQLTDIWDKNAIGADGRHFTLRTLLDLQIPLPSLPEQEAIVSLYKDKIKKAEELEQQAEQMRESIETYLLDELGIDRQKKAGNSQNNGFKFLKFIRFKDANRWDVYNGEPEAILRLKQSKFPLAEIGKAYNFIKRSWDKKEKVFRYVEIGSVDALKGIMYAEEIPTSKAPSRASQKIKTKDLIIGTTRPYLKKFAIVNQDFNDCVCSSGFQVVAPNETNNISFLYEYLMTTPAIAQFELFMTGALYPAITNKDLKKVLIPLPALEIQNAIVEHINEQKEQIKELKKQVEKLRKEALEEYEKEIFE